MTNHWIDIKNSDVIMIIGSNAAENHPISFKWVQEAINRGATLISVDPRYTRSSSKATVTGVGQLYSQMRSGTDIAFLGGIIKYALDNGKINNKYIKECTNALFKVNTGFKTCRTANPHPLGGTATGIFTGLQTNPHPAADYKYDTSSWQYQAGPALAANLNDPDCVFQHLKTHYTQADASTGLNYDKATVCKITGADPIIYDKICKKFTSTYTDDRSATIMYAMGGTQHTYGAQTVRSYAVLQLLLGNIGVAGGGINALRGESNVQGSTDHCLLYHILPGYLPCVEAKVGHSSLASYAPYTPTIEPTHSYTVLGVTKDPTSANWWQHRPKYITSLLKAWWPDTNHVNSFHYLPKKTPATQKWYTHICMFERMVKEPPEVKALMCWGQNPAVGGPNANIERQGLDKLEWLVVADLWETETAAHWKRPGVTPGNIGTEVFLLPAAASYEKEGSITNSGRWSQWRYKAADPPGDALDDLEIIKRLGEELKALYATSSLDQDKPITELNWGPYPGQDYDDAYGHADPHKVAKEINGYYLPGHANAGKLVTSFGALLADGKTSSGNWLYCDSYDEDGNKAARRNPVDAANNIGLYPNWSWCWPVNRRIIYNRASTYQSDGGVNGDAGDPLAPGKWVIRWSGSAWEGDVPDHGAAPGGVYPFIMKPEGHARLHGYGLKDGPYPEHYEPWETVLSANILSDTKYSPAAYINPNAVARGEQGDPGDYPLIATTYRLTEHWQAGAMTRNNPWQCELMPDAFVEMSEELASEKGIANGEVVRIRTKRTDLAVTAGTGTHMLAVACVTKRFKPYKINGSWYHHVGVVWHWGYSGLCQGYSGNLLTPHVGDCNTGIPEYKAFICQIDKIT